MSDVSMQQEDLRLILDALGLSTGARPYSPHEVVHRDVLPAIERLREKVARVEALDDYDGPHPAAWLVALRAALADPAPVVQRDDATDGGA